MGQKLINEVSRKIPANTTSKSPKVPEIVFEKYKTTIAIATSVLKTLSDVPMFVFIVIVLTK